MKSTLTIDLHSTNPCKPMKFGFPAWIVAPNLCFRCEMLTAKNPLFEGKDVDRTQENPVQ